MICDVKLQRGFTLPERVHIRPGVPGQALIETSPCLLSQLDNINITAQVDLH